MEQRENETSDNSWFAMTYFAPGVIVKDIYLEGTFMRVTRVDEKARRVHFVYLHSGLEGSYNEEQVIRYMELANETVLGALGAKVIDMSEAEIKNIVREVIDDIESHFSETELVIGESLIGSWRDRLECIVGPSEKWDKFCAEFIAKASGSEAK